eukprot:8685245-Alexandrium_andersonii.AAC.1
MWAAIRDSPLRNPASRFCYAESALADLRTHESLSVHARPRVVATARRTGRGPPRCARPPQRCTAAPQRGSSGG